MKLQIQTSAKETDLIAACKKQKAKAQRRVYDKYAPGMLALCRRYVKDISEAEDVMIRGFMKVFDKIKSFEHKGSFEGWIKRIMINESLSFIRKNKSMYLETDIEAAERKPDLNQLNDELETQDLLNMVAALPAGYRTIFNLYAIEGYSHREIGELLGISENTSKSQLSRGRSLLQKRLLQAEEMLNKKEIGDGK